MSMFNNLSVQAQSLLVHMVQNNLFLTKQEMDERTVYGIVKIGSTQGIFIDKVIVDEILCYFIDMGNGNYIFNLNYEKEVLNVLSRSD